MIDREKVIKGLDCCIKQGEQGILDCDYDCPYGEHGNRLDCWIKMNRDALALLKEQDAVKPYVTGRGESFETAETWWYACGNCHEALDPDDKYCRHCGRQVKLDD